MFLSCAICFQCRQIICQTCCTIHCRLICGVISNCIVVNHKRWLESRIIFTRSVWNTVHINTLKVLEDVVINRTIHQSANSCTFSGIQI